MLACHGHTCLANLAMTVLDHVLPFLCFLERPLLKVSLRTHSRISGIQGECENVHDKVQEVTTSGHNDTHREPIARKVEYDYGEMCHSEE